MASSLAEGLVHRFLRVASKLTILSTGRLQIVPKANPATCKKGELNVGTDGKLYVCSADDTWTVVGTQA